MSLSVVVTYYTVITSDYQ